MATRVKELMSDKLVTLTSSAPVVEAARQMRAADVGAVIVQDGDTLRGIVTDRDIAIRAVAEDRAVSQTPVSEICSSELITVGPDDHLDAAVRRMREKAIRRVLVVDGQQKAIGILSIGDLAMARDSSSVLGQISAAPANH
jgi:CBS domain-containing protein